MALDFLAIFSMAVDTNAVVTTYVSNAGGALVWQPILRRDAFDWEIPRVVQLLDRFQGKQVCSGEEDRRLWKNGPGGQFTVKAWYKQLAGIEEMPGPGEWCGTMQSL